MVLFKKIKEYFFYIGLTILLWNCKSEPVNSIRMGYNSSNKSILVPRKAPRTVLAYLDFNADQIIQIKKKKTKKKSPFFLHTIFIQLLIIKFKLNLKKRIINSHKFLG